MNKWIPISLWVLVAILGAWVWYQRSQPAGALDDGPIFEGGGDGRVFVQLPWKHLSAVGDIQLTDQRGQRFSSAEQVGRPYLVNFFFSTCPTICRQFNGQMQELAQQFKQTDLGLLSITVDAETDTPELLMKYAESFLADHDQWKFLTGPQAKVAEVGTQVFFVPLEKETHTEKIFLIDRWGKIRDWFDWNQANELRRLKETVDEVLAESSPPWDKTVRTRYALAGGFADRWSSVPWIKEFKLTDSDGQTFYSRDQEGQVWLASFFFSTCPGICPQMNRHLATYQTRLTQLGVPLVSITTRPSTDTPAVLREYARTYRSDAANWKFLTGDQVLTSRVLNEFFRAAGTHEHHSSRLYLVDRWGNVRGDFDWQSTADEAALWKWIQKLQAEQVPPRSLAKVYPPPTLLIDPDQEDVAEDVD